MRLRRANRIALLGGLLVLGGLLLLPLVELRPNRLASGIPLGGFDLGGVGLLLLGLAALPLGLAWVLPPRVRGWALAGTGNLLLVLTLWLPALAGVEILENAAQTLGEGVRVSNPRLLPGAALALGLFGLYVLLRGALADLRDSGAPRPLRELAAWSGVALVAGGFLLGQFDVYSVVVEFAARGETLLRSVVEHLLLVAVALGLGCVLGLSLGLWAFREAWAAPLVLYTVGIIQTIPSLALFGVLLVPLARLGDQRVGAVAVAFGVLLAVALLLALLYRRLARALPLWGRRSLLFVSALAAAPPLALFVVVTASLLFRAGALAATSPEPPFGALRWTLLAALVLGPLLGVLGRAAPVRLGLGRVLRHGSLGAYAVSGAALLGALALGVRGAVAAAPGAALTVRDLGVSGIGPAPAVVALTLYALLPLVRNTYAGLRGVDPAVTDAGRGVGMSAWQRLTQLELPLALPVILAGVRSAGVALVGIATIASLIGAGGLGDFILGGIVNISVDQILLGTVPAVGLALLLDGLIRGLGAALTPPGLREREGT